MLKEIGHGASGVVYLVRRKYDRALFALKTIIKVDVFSSESSFSNLVNERIALAEAARRHSPFIVRLVDAFETPGHLCFVTELGSFGDLKHVFAKLPDNLVPEAISKKLFAEMVLGLEDTHRMGYLYRDLKLGNMLLNQAGHVRLADFGLVKRLEVELEGSCPSSESDTDEECDEKFRLVGRTSSFVGTRRYMSPEHFNWGHGANRGYGAPADVWALGVSLYLMLVGNYPFGRYVSPKDSPAMFDAIRSEEIVYPSWMGEEAVGMLKGLLERDVLKRFNIEEIKSHPWMKSIDWNQVQADSADNIAQEDVLALMRESGVRKVEEQNELEDSSQYEDNFSLVSSSVSDLSTKLSPWSRKPAPDMGLVGFGYCT